MIKVETVAFWNGDKVKIKAKNTAYKSVISCAQFIQNQAKMLCPVMTGNLRGSIIIKYNSEKGQVVRGEGSQDGSEISMPKEKETAHVGTAVIYGPAVEFGIKTSDRYPMQPYLRPAFDLASGKVLTIITKEGKSEFADYIK